MYPTAVQPLSGGRVLVADFYDDRVAAYQLDGTFLGQFGRQSKHPGGFHYPSEIRLSGHRLYVSQTASDTVTIFDLSEWAPAAAVLPPTRRHRLPR